MLLSGSDVLYTHLNLYRPIWHKYGRRSENSSALDERIPVGSGASRFARYLKKIRTIRIIAIIKRLKCHIIIEFVIF